MATTIQQIDPLDLNSAIGVGVNLPFTGKAVFNTTYTTQEATKANLINYFLTDKGERFLNPTFGSGIRGLLFNNVDEDSLLTLKERISKELKIFFPRVETTQFTINSNPDSNQVTVFVSYKIKNSNIEDEILINIEQ